jgi:hypothetical protein
LSIPPAAFNEPFHGIERHHMARIGSNEIFWLSWDLFSFYTSLPGAAWFLRTSSKSSAILDEPANSGRLWERHTMFAAESPKRHIDFIFPKVRMQFPKPPYLLDRLIRPQSPSSFLRSAGDIVERLKIAASFFQLFLPEEQGTAFQLKCFQGCRKSVSFPKSQRAGFMEGFFGDHSPVSYRQPI